MPQPLCLSTQHGPRPRPAPVAVALQCDHETDRRRHTDGRRATHRQRADGLDDLIDTTIARTTSAPGSRR